MSKVKKINSELVGEVTREPTDIVIDNRAFLSIANVPFKEDVSHSLHVISDIARIVEAFVFYKRVIVFLYPARDMGEISFSRTRQQYAYSSLRELAENENVLYFVTPPEESQEVSHPTELVKQAVQLGAKLDYDITKPDWGHGLDNGYFLYQQELARQSKLPFVPSEEKRDLAESYMSKSYQARINLGRSIISTLDSATQKDIDLLQKAGVPIQFYIPPLLSLVLENVVKGASFGEAIWGVRERFKKVRSLICDYGILLENTSLSISKILKTRDKIFKDIELLSSSFERRDRTRLKEWIDILDVIPDVLKDVGMGNIPKVSLIATLAKLPLEEIRGLILKRRYNSLFKARRDFYNIKNYADLLGKSMLPYQKKWERDFGRDWGMMAISTQPTEDSKDKVTKTKVVVRKKTSKRD